MTAATAHPVTARSPASIPARAARRTEGHPSKLAWWLFVLFLILEFDRPPLLAALKLQMIISIVLPVIWLGGKERPWSMVLTAQLALLVSTLFMLPFAMNYYAVYFTARTLFSSIGIAIAMSWMFADRIAMRQFYWAWLLVIGWVGLYGITHGGRGPGGFLGDENDLALACVAAFPFAFYGFQLLGGWKRIAVGALGVVLVMAIVASISRGGFVGLVVALAYCLFSGANKLRNLALAVVASGVFLVSVPGDYMDEMSTIQKTDEGTAETRRFLWITAFNVWKAYPVLGAGGGNFNFVAGDYVPKDGKWNTPDYQERSWSGTTVHSSYFQILSELGLVGVGLYGAMVYGHLRGMSRLRKIARTRNDLPKDLRNEIELFAGSLAAGMIGTLGANAFLSSAFYPYAYFYAGAGVALVAWVGRLVPSATRTPSKAPAAPP